MSVLDTITPRQDQARTLPGQIANDKADTPVPMLDAMAANWRLSLDRDEAGNFNNKVQAYNDLEDALVAMGNPRSRYRDPRWGGWIQSVETSPDRFKALWGDVVAARRRDPRAFADLPQTQQDFDVWAFGRKGQHARDAVTAERGGIGTAIVPGLAFGISTAGSAENLPFLALGGGGRSLAEVLVGEALNGARMTAVMTPQTVRSAANMGETTTPGQMGEELLMGAATNAAVGTGLRFGPAAVNRAAKAVVDRVLPMDLKMAKELERATGAPWERTPQQQAAINILNLHGDLAATSPFADTHAGMAAHQARVAGATAALDGQSGVDGYLAAVRRSESGGNPNARNPMPGQTASGLYGFTNKTWVGAYRAEFPNSGLSEQAMLARKGDPALQERLMRRLTTDNAERLRAMGMEATPANLYVMHHLGTGDGPKILRAAADTPLSELLSERVIAANPHMQGKTVGEFRAWAGRKMGGDHGAIETPAAAPAVFDETGLADAERARSAADAEVAAGMRDTPEGLDLPPEAPAVDGADAPGGVVDEVPQLRPDAFEDETSWRVAQSEIEAQHLGQDAPGVTRQSVWDDARSELMAAREGVFHDALYHEDTGPIDVPWGDEASGLAKVSGEAPEVLPGLPALLDDMHVVAERSTGKRVHMETADGRASARLDWNPERERWQLASVRRAPESAKSAPAVGQLRGARGGRPVSPQASSNPKAMEVFNSPAGEGPTMVADSAWHDVRATLGDAAEHTSVDLGDGRGARSVAQIDEDLSADAAAIEAIKGCL